MCKTGSAFMFPSKRTVRREPRALAGMPSANAGISIEARSRALIAAGWAEMLRRARRSRGTSIRSYRSRLGSPLRGHGAGGATRRSRWSAFIARADVWTVNAMRRSQCRTSPRSMNVCGASSSIAWRFGSGTASLRESVISRITVLTAALCKRTITCIASPEAPFSPSEARRLVRLGSSGSRAECAWTGIRASSREPRERMREWERRAPALRRRLRHARLYGSAPP
jgi:hypothetical protein